MPDKDAANMVPGGNETHYTSKPILERASGPLNAAQQAQEQPQKLSWILVVEDDASLAHLEANFLAAHGYAVEVVGSGEQAVSLLDQRIPDLVVLDLELSGILDGWQVLQTLRLRTHIPVLLTTSLNPEVRKYLRSCGESRFTLDHLPKPFPMQALLKHIKRMLIPAPD
jgi:DNA-binding response OmpR family regulator